MIDSASKAIGDLASVVFSREAVAVFDDAKSLEAAIDELRVAGFSRAQISVLADEDAVSEKLGGDQRA